MYWWMALNIHSILVQGYYKFTLFFSNQPITDISCGDGHNLALSSTGVVYSWGDNSVSQLGLSVSYTEVTKPRQVNIPSGFQVSQVACGANFSAALTSELIFRYSFRGFVTH